MTTDVLSVLTKARALISKPENWCQYVFTQEVEDGITAFCARGAIYTTLEIDNDFYDKHSITDRPYCTELVKTLKGGRIHSDMNVTDIVAAYNNKNTHAKVLAMFDATIARLKREKTISELASVKDDAVSELETV